MFEKKQDRRSRCEGMPLCRRYQVVSFRSLLLSAVASESSIGVPMLWAMGGLTDGSVEVFGAWMQAGREQQAWEAATEEIRHRGVEQVRVVLADDMEAANAAFPGALVVMPDAAYPLDRSSSGALSRRQWRIVDRIQQLADGIQLGVLRRLKRKAPFGSAADSLAFVEEALRRAECRVCASADASNGAPQRTGSRVPSISAAA
jgi:hypothetical protein